jgi:pilus assembly protein CpaD
MATSLNRFIVMTLTRTLLVAAAFTLAALCLAACESEHSEEFGRAHPPQPLNPGAQYVLKAAPSTDKIALAPHADGLSPAQVKALKEFVERRADVDGGVVTISLPQGGADTAAVGRAADAAQAQLNVAGVQVQRSTYASDDAKAPLMVSFDYEKAEKPHCGQDWGDIAKTFDNAVYTNFGCAVTANMAAQIANPSDIAHPRAEDAPDVERRMTVLDKYRAGKVTASDAPQDKGYGAAISHVGQ